MKIDVLAQLSTIASIQTTSTPTEVGEFRAVLEEQQSMAKDLTSGHSSSQEEDEKTDWKESELVGLSETWLYQSLLSTPTLSEASQVEASFDSVEPLEALHGMDSLATSIEKIEVTSPDMERSTVETSHFDSILSEMEAVFEPLTEENSSLESLTAMMTAEEVEVQGQVEGDLNLESIEEIQAFEEIFDGLQLDSDENLQSEMETSPLMDEGTVESEMAMPSTEIEIPTYEDVQLEIRQFKVKSSLSFESDKSNIEPLQISVDVSEEPMAHSVLSGLTTTQTVPTDASVMESRGFNNIMGRWENQTEIMDQLVQQASLLKEGDATKLTLKLVPHHLGTLHVELELQQGQLSGKIVAENPEVAQSLEKALQAMTQETLSLKTVQVETQFQSSMFSDSQRESEANASISKRYLGVEEDEDLETELSLSELGVRLIL